MMLSVAEAAQRAKRDPETIRRWIRAGKLIAWKVGGQHVIDEDDLADAGRGTLSAPQRAKAAEWEPSSAMNVAALHRSRAERSHALREAVAPYFTNSAPAQSPSAPLGDFVLSQIVGRIVRAVDPTRIILFGSRVRGDHRVDSDYDLLVVLDSVGHRREERIRIRHAFDDLPVAADILVAATSEADGDVPGRPIGAVAWALREGRLVYTRDPVD